MKNKISIIIVDYNTIEKTFAYIDELNAKVKPKCCFNIIIVDNTEDRVSESWINGQSDFRISEAKSLGGVDSIIGLYNDINVVVCFADDNVGYGKGNNIGFNVEMELFSNEYVIFSNNDLLLDKDLDVDLLLKPFDDDRIAIVGPSVLDITRVEHQNPYKYISFWQYTVVNFYHMLSDKLFFFFESNIDYDGRSKECYWVSGCFMVVRSRDFRRVGGFDERVFLYGEEVILSERLLRIGKTCYFNNNVEIVHNHSSVVRSNMSEVERMRLSAKASRYYFREYKHVCKLKIIVADLLFEIFVPLFLLKNTIKKLVRSNLTTKSSK